MEKHFQVAAKHLQIDEILKLISEIWHKHPNLRLCQLTGNIFVDKDLYYVEDDELQDGLEKKYL